ncbi:hypothetical protein [Streptomyces violaceusniger]|uniref:hypothetical protein n=1 Tax=Streptomyces violaceusniger TaxID=68280 RepID=UPI003F55EB82
MRRKRAQYGPVRGWRRRGLTGVDQLQSQPGRQRRRPSTRAWAPVRARVCGSAPTRTGTPTRIHTGTPTRIHTNAHTGAPTRIRTNAPTRTHTGTPARIHTSAHTGTSTRIRTSTPASTSARAPARHRRPFRPHPRLHAVRVAHPQRCGAAVGPYAPEFGRVGVGGLVPVRQQLAPWGPFAADRAGADLYPAAEVGGGLVPDDADERERPYARRGDPPVGRGRGRGRSVAAGRGHTPVESVHHERKERQRLRGAGGCGGPLGPGVGGAGIDGEGQGEGGGARDADRGCQVCTHD